MLLLTAASKNSNNKQAKKGGSPPGSYQKYVSHPFHIHINDYQVKDRDNAMNYRESLQDVSPLNSSGYGYYMVGEEDIISKQPVSGELKVIEDALDPNKIIDLFSN